ncbi:MAG: Zn-ribbon domain-containing OB-fold protein [Candidatus Humimicrobiaceae bacterium]
MIEEEKFTKPLPEIRPETKEYWEAAKKHELLLQKCKSCGQVIYFPRIICYRCLSEELRWFKSSGYGAVYSFTIIRQAAYKGFELDVPYVYAIIDLDDNARMISNIINIELIKIKIGMRVKVTFEDVSPEISIPKFEPA